MARCKYARCCADVSRASRTPRTSCCLARQSAEPRCQHECTDRICSARCRIAGRRLAYRSADGNPAAARRHRRIAHIGCGARHAVRAKAYACLDRTASSAVCACADCTRHRSYAAHHCQLAFCARNIVGNRTNLAFACLRRSDRLARRHQISGITSSAIGCRRQSGTCRIVPFAANIDPAVVRGTQTEPANLSWRDFRAHIETPRCGARYTDRHDSSACSASASSRPCLFISRKFTEVFSCYG